MTNKRKQKSRPLRLLRLPYLAVGGVVAILAILAILELTNTTHLLHTDKTKTMVIPTTHSKSSVPPSTQASPSPSSSPTSSPTSSSPSTPTTNKGTNNSSPNPPPTNTPGPPPTTPWGTFISNHTPGRYGSPTQEVSVCNTTPGATCAMSFTNGSATKTLPAQTTDNSGSTTWNWDTAQAGFTNGHWQVTVTATLNGKTATAQDSIDVGP